MKKAVAGIPVFLIMLLFSGCDTIGSKTGSVSVVYAIAAIISLLLLVGCFFLLKNRNAWFVVLLSSVLVVNIGYYLLSVAGTLEFALWANRISYLGSVFLPLSMLMIILQVTGTNAKKWLSSVLISLAILVFLVAASPGVLDIYYRSVTLKTVSGATVLEKVYGPLHSLYLIYLLGYFVAMIGVIIRSGAKKRIKSPVHAAVLLIAVFINIGVWLLEQLVNIDFELLAISYIISEMFLLSLYLIMQESEKILENLRTQQKKAKPAPSAPSIDFSAGIARLTPAEQNIYRCYLAGMTTKEVLAELNITENTLKYHNRNLYGKLGVSSRKQLLEYAAQSKPEQE